MSNILIAILSSSVFATLITVIYSKKTKDKDDKLKYITDERRQWRTEIRSKIETLATILHSNKNTNDPEMLERMKNQFINNDNFDENTWQWYLKSLENSNATLKDLKVFFQCRLNPYDEEDNKLLKLFDDQKNIEKINRSLTVLLKHDWERAKEEANPKITHYKVILGYMVLVLLFYIFRSQIIEAYDLKQYNFIKSINVRESLRIFINIKLFLSIFILLLIPYILKIALILTKLHPESYKYCIKERKLKLKIYDFFKIRYREEI